MKIRDTSRDGIELSTLLNKKVLSLIKKYHAEYISLPLTDHIILYYLESYPENKRTLFHCYQYMNKYYTVTKMRDIKRRFKHLEKNKLIVHDLLTSFGKAHVTWSITSMGKRIISSVFSWKDII